MKKSKYKIDFYEWYEFVKPILENEEFQNRKKYMHHDDITVYDHVINVSLKSYSMAKRLHLNWKDASVAGLLHDFYCNPWMSAKIKKPFFQKHGFTHANDALQNSRKYFSEYMNPVVENAILRHMFPLNIVPPKHLIGWIVTTADKIVSFEVLLKPKFFIRLVSFKYNKNYKN